MPDTRSHTRVFTQSSLTLNKHYSVHRASPELLGIRIITTTTFDSILIPWCLIQLWIYSHLIRDRRFSLLQYTVCQTIHQCPYSTQIQHETQLAIKMNGFSVFSFKKKKTLMTLINLKAFYNLLPSMRKTKTRGRWSCSALLWLTSCLLAVESCSFSDAPTSLSETLNRLRNRLSSKFSSSVVCCSVCRSAGSHLLVSGRLCRKSSRCTWNWGCTRSVLCNLTFDNNV